MTNILICTDLVYGEQPRGDFQQVAMADVVITVNEEGVANLHKTRSHHNAKSVARAIEIIHEAFNKGNLKWGTPTGGA